MIRTEEIMENGGLLNEKIIELRFSSKMGH